MGKIEDLKVLQQYLSPDELKEVAKEVFKENLSRWLAQSNTSSKDNFEYYAKKGAYLAVVDYSKEIKTLDIEDLQSKLNTKVYEIIEGLEHYQIPYNDLIRKAVAANEERIKNKVDSVIQEVLSDNGKYDNIYYKVNENIGYLLGEKVMEILKQAIENE